MDSDSPKPSPTSRNSGIQRTLAEMERLLEQVAVLSESDVDQPRFLESLIACAVTGVGARRGAVWLADRRPGELPGAHIDFSGDDGGPGTPASGIGRRLAAHAGHDLVLTQVLEAMQASVVLPGMRDAETQQELNPTGGTLYLTPVIGRGRRAEAVLEVLRDEIESPAASEATGQLLEAFAEAASGYFDRRRLMRLQERIDRLNSWERLTERLHSSLDSEAVAYTAVNEGRELIGCDRISLVVERRRRLRLLAASGQTQLDPRSPVVAAIEDLARAVAAGGEPIWFPSPSRNLPPEIETRVQALCDLTNARQLGVWPLAKGGPPPHADDEQQAPYSGIERHAAGHQIAGAMVFENWTVGDSGAQALEPYSALVRQTALAIENCRRHESLPFYNVVSRLAGWKFFRQLSQVRLGLGAIAIATAALCLIPAELTVTGHGTIQPKERRDVFARTDGVVERIETTHGAHCTGGEVLLTLTRPQLDLEQTRVAGELQTARRRLAGLEAARLQSDPQTAADREKINQNTAEEEELRETVAGLERQRILLELQAEELLVRAPITGSVLTWDVQELLASRPVQRGQLLLTVADLNGPWILEVDIPDEAIGHLLAHRSRTTESPTVTFMLATEPGITYTGVLERVALSAEPDQNGGQRVRTVVRIPDGIAALRRPGAAVIPRFHCGRFPVGYVWLHAAWESIQKHVLF